jgi:type II restriction enzyme
MPETTRLLIDRWKQDPNGTYQSWFLWPERLKNFRSIRRGIGQVIKEIDEGTFGNVYRGSSLQTVVASIAEQRQIFKGPIMRSCGSQNCGSRISTKTGTINAPLDGCCMRAIAAPRRPTCSGDPHARSQGHQRPRPAAANLLYFIHPTIVVPFNTAIVKGYNALTGAAVKLGRWDHYLAMRQGLIEFNQRHRDLLSNDLGAVAGLMFDLGMERYPLPPAEGMPRRPMPGPRIWPQSGKPPPLPSTNSTRIGFPTKGTPKCKGG